MVNLRGGWVKAPGCEDMWAGGWVRGCDNDPVPHVPEEHELPSGIILQSVDGSLLDPDAIDPPPHPRTQAFVV